MVNIVGVTVVTAPSPRATLCAMDTHALLIDSVGYLTATLIAVPLFKRLGLGAVLGYLAAGVVIGPWGLKLIGDAEGVLHLAEFGVVLLLFVIGLELNPKRLWVMRTQVFVGGALQVFITGALLVPALMMFDLSLSAAVLVALALALSSTAFALQTLAEKEQLATAYGRKAFGILLFQDIAAIPLLALAPLLGASAGGAFDWMGIAKALGVILGVILGGHYLLIPLLRGISRFGSQEVFTIAALLIVFGTAAMMESVGLSMALGAFLAGVLLADSEHRHELEADIEPFKGLLLGLFFVAVGMSLDLGLVARFPLQVLGLSLGLMLLKAVVLFALGKLSGLKNRDAVRLAAVMPQGGEFAFVVLGAAVAAGGLAQPVVDWLIVVVCISMGLNPLIYALVEWMTPETKSKTDRPYDDIADDADAFVVVAGFGRFGQIPSRILGGLDVHFTAVEQSSRRVDFVRKFGNQIYYGDASRLELLRAARVAEAKALILAVDDIEMSLAVARLMRKHFPDIPVFARATDRQHAFALMDIGVEYLVRDTLYSSLDLTRHLLVKLGYSPCDAERYVNEFRERDQALLERQAIVHENEEALIGMAQEFSVELTALFEADQQSSSVS